MPERPIPRGEHRLMIAGRLLQPKAADIDEALRRVRALPVHQADELRGLVDWVEEYELEEFDREGATR